MLAQNGLDQNAGGNVVVGNQNLHIVLRAMGACPNCALSRLITRRGR
jgi:Fe-S cluster biogenesis protein NfuA